MITSHTLPPIKAEIGGDGDWKTHGLVEEVGSDDSGEIQIMITRSNSRFELWHKDGMRMRIPLDNMLDAAAEQLLAHIRANEGQL